MPRNGLYIGMMSGTSMDAIDACLVSFNPPSLPQILAHASLNLTDLRPRLQALHRGQTPTSEFDCLDELGVLETLLAERSAEVVHSLLDQAGVSASEILAIGQHGQTLRHRPNYPTPFTLQIGNPSLIAERTGIAVIADFRRRDLAAGGQGAPLVPTAHRAFFNASAPNQALITVNLGGIANLAVLQPDQPLIGFDTGPANTLLDGWIRQQRNLPFDEGGAFAACGKVHDDLLNALLADPYFALPPPKSTGTEVFNLDWLATRAGDWLIHLPAEDLQATLSELTARSIIQAMAPYLQTMPGTQVVLAGGGAYNTDLVGRLRSNLQTAAPDAVLKLSDEFGIPPQCAECAAFAWLARQFLLGEAGNAPSVTGARAPRILGGFYPGKLDWRSLIG
ncbi:anhydro-N-acetylmuramic acid kinase [Halothiobacillus sp. DCM-1]|uniref:anhydro-N-acetylmuramic acid kinase n=1 Tax=Halothiobacillus sp. DCM-1 TaxID=3112558 RepID=UPI003249F8D5